MHIQLYQYQYAVQLMQADCDFFERVIARFGVETDELAIT